MPYWKIQPELDLSLEINRTQMVQQGAILNIVQWVLYQTQQVSKYFCGFSVHPANPLWNMKNC